MLVYGLIVVVLLVVVVAVAYTWHATRGSTPPELREEGKPAPAGRDRTWDPHERYDDDGPPAASP